MYYLKPRAALILHIFLKGITENAGIFMDTVGELLLK